MRTFNILPQSELEITDLQERGIVEMRITAEVIEKEVVGGIFLADNKPIAEIFLDKYMKYLGIPEEKELNDFFDMERHAIICGGDVLSNNSQGQLWLDYDGGSRIAIPLVPRNPLIAAPINFIPEMIIVPKRIGEALTMSGIDVDAAKVTFQPIMQIKYRDIRFTFTGPKLKVKNKNYAALTVYLTQRPLLPVTRVSGDIRETR